jgi:hypothetical protein
VEREEDAGVEGGDVVLLCKLIVSKAVLRKGLRIDLPAMCFVAQSAFGSTEICSWPLWAIAPGSRERRRSAETRCRHGRIIIARSETELRGN